jgi:hypothetical protein
MLLAETATNPDKICYLLFGAVQAEELRVTGFNFRVCASHRGDTRTRDRLEATDSKTEDRKLGDSLLLPTCNLQLVTCNLQLTAPAGKFLP